MAVGTCEQERHREEGNQYGVGHTILHPAAANSSSEKARLSECSTKISKPFWIRVWAVSGVMGDLGRVQKVYELVLLTSVRRA